MGNENCCSNKPQVCEHATVKPHDIAIVEENDAVMEEEPRIIDNLPGQKQNIRHYPTPLFYIEKHVDGHDTMSQLGVAAESCDRENATNTDCSCRSAHVAARTLSVLQGEITSALCASVDKGEVARFKDQLEKGGVDPSNWGKADYTKSIEQLFWEVHVQRGSILLDTGAALKRLTHILRIRLLANISGIERILLSRLQMVYSGEARERKQVPLIRLQWPEGFKTDNFSDPLLYSADSPYVESVELAVKRALKECLGLSEPWQEQHLGQDSLAHTHRVEDDGKSLGFPGLLTCYSIHEVTLRVLDPDNSGVACIGLPSGGEFATAAGDFSCSMLQQDDGFPIGTQLNIWTWDNHSSLAPKAAEAIPNTMNPIEDQPVSIVDEKACHKEGAQIATARRREKTTSEAYQLITRKASSVVGPLTWTLSTGLDKGKVAKFQDELKKGGIDTSTWGKANNKSIEQLFWEVRVQRGSILLNSGATLKRLTHILKIRLLADILGVEHILLSRLQMVFSGESRERKQVPLLRLQWPEGFTPDNVSDPLLYAADCPYVERVENAVKRTLKERLGLSESWQEKHLEKDSLAHAHRVEDDGKSPGFPGLVTCYSVHEVTLKVLDPEDSGVACIGLPSGDEFATAEGDFNSSMSQQEEGCSVGSQLNIWTWQTYTSFNLKASQSISTRRRSIGYAQHEPWQKSKQVPVIKVSDMQPAMKNQATTVQTKSNSKIIQSLFGRRASREGELVFEEAKKACPYLLAAHEEGQEINWKRIRFAAQHITSDNYSLKDFNSDISSFPELFWYLLDDDNAPDAVCHSTSGRSSTVEFQRTMGAFFAIYWLMRLRGDGKEGFSFGVDQEWRPVHMNQDTISDEHPSSRLQQLEKRIKFFKESSWEHFEKLLIDSELLVRGLHGQLNVNENRVVALLALTAVHDLMKLQSLLPTVQPRHAPYHGYNAGETIADHDHALSYIMDHFPHLLPSFNGLDSAEKASVKFTQCQLQFNHGWFVQAEAPPGAILTHFRELLTKEKKSQIKERDIALYFVHWLTDLAGAEPTPLGGCEMFTVKFPLHVLNSFLRSFAFVQKISTRTETQVMEEYLCTRWKESDLKLGPIPSGDGAVAKMRLLCMAQMNAKHILEAFDELPSEDQEILSIEMARTGCAGQSFSSHLCPYVLTENPKGPAILVYYGPAFLQNLGKDDPASRLSFLAEVYRCARELWTATVAEVGKWVTVRVDTIKSLSIQDILNATRDNNFWLIIKHNESEGFVESSSRRKLNTFIANRQEVQVLGFDTAFDNTRFGHI